MVFVVPGLTSEGSEFYVTNIFNKALDSGYDACVVNHRGCAGVPLKTPLLYSAGSYDGLKKAIEIYKKANPKQPRFAVGFSLGANILGKYLAEHEDSGIEAAACICGPMCIIKSSDYLESKFFGGFS